jgi:hypothetical protein
MESYNFQNQTMCLYSHEDGGGVISSLVTLFGQIMILHTVELFIGKKWLTWWSDNLSLGHPSHYSTRDLF